MRKLTAILLLAVFAISNFGYKWALNQSVKYADDTVNTAIETNSYDAKALIEIVLPLSMPYYTYTTNGYEKYNGEVTANGITYKVVERKIESGKLYARCLPAYSKDEIQKQVSATFSHDENGNKDSDKSTGFKAKKAVDDFEELYKTAVSNNTNTISVSLNYISRSLSGPYSTGIIKPPCLS